MLSITLVPTGPEAVQSLRKILRDAEGESARVSAARVILELGVRVVEIGDIEERLDKLEQIAKSRWKGSSDDREDQTPTRPVRGVNGPA